MTEIMEKQTHDKRFAKQADPYKYFVPMCKDCGLCCLDRDWSTAWNGELVGICHNLDHKSGQCIDEHKKSLRCRVFVCKDFDGWLQRVKTILSRKCPTATRMVQECMVRKGYDLTYEDSVKIQEVYNG